MRKILASGLNLEVLREFHRDIPLPVTTPLRRTTPMHTQSAARLARYATSKAHERPQAPVRVTLPPEFGALKRYRDNMDIEIGRLAQHVERRSTELHPDREQKLRRKLAQARVVLAEIVKRLAAATETMQESLA